MHFLPILYINKLYPVPMTLTGFNQPPPPYNTGVPNHNGILPWGNSWSHNSTAQNIGENQKFCNQQSYNSNQTNVEYCNTKHYYGGNPIVNNFPQHGCNGHNSQLSFNLSNHQINHDFNIGRQQPTIYSSNHQTNHDFNVGRQQPTMDASYHQTNHDFNAGRQEPTISASNSDYNSRVNRFLERTLAPPVVNYSNPQKNEIYRSNYNSTSQRANSSQMFRAKSYISKSEKNIYNNYSEERKSSENYTHNTNVNHRNTSSNNLNQKTVSVPRTICANNEKQYPISQPYSPHSSGSMSSNTSDTSKPQTSNLINQSNKKPVVDLQFNSWHKGEHVTRADSQVVRSNSENPTGSNVNVQKELTYNKCDVNEYQTADVKPEITNFADNKDNCDNDDSRVYLSSTNDVLGTIKTEKVVIKTEISENGDNNQDESTSDISNDTIKEEPNENSVDFNSIKSENGSYNECSSLSAGTEFTVANCTSSELQTESIGSEIEHKLSTIPTANNFNGNRNQFYNNLSFSNFKTDHISNDIGYNYVRHEKENLNYDNVVHHYDLYNASTSTMPNHAYANGSSSNYTFNSKLDENSKAFISKCNGYNISRSPSPERKYRHLIREPSSSPERKFLERINTPTASKKSRYSSREPSFSKEKSRSPPRIYSKPNGRRNLSADRTQGPAKRQKTWSCDSASYGRKHNSSVTNSVSNKELPNNINDKITEREELLRKYTKHYCSNINEVKHMMKLSELSIAEIVEREAKLWSRMSPATLYYGRTSIVNVVEGTQKLADLCQEFENVLVKRADNIRASKPKYEPPVRKQRIKCFKHRHGHGPSSNSSSGSSSDSSDDSDYDSTDEEDRTMEELERKQSHPYRLHPELWYNDPGDMNDGPLCRCSAKARRSGIRHNIYAGEQDLPKCNLNSNNGDKLFHYRITISPPTNFLIKTPTIISHDDHEFIFEGFSMFSHRRLDKLPVCKVIRFNIEYTILYFEEQQLENFTINELNLFSQYMFKELLELVDLDFKADGDKSLCDQFHFMPRFVRELSDHGKEILSMNEVLMYLLNNCDDLVKEEQLATITSISQYEWQKQVDLIKGMVVTIPGMKPCALRVDQLDRDDLKDSTNLYPEIVHFGIRPPQLSYAGNPEYQKAWREYVKFRHLLANMSKPSFEDKRKLEVKEMKLQEMRTQSKMKRDVTVTVNSKGFKKTGIMCDIVQHAMLIPVLVSHLRFHCSLNVLESVIQYKFKNRYLLQLALTHPSYRENFGTNPDHARNSLTNCGIRQPEYGDRRIHYMNTRKRGINTLINIMSRFGKKKATESNITHNERLEFLGDAVVEFITSIHLFHMFPDLEEGGLATYRAAIVQNQHLAVLAKILKLDEYMLYAHGSDLCHDLELRHAMANCFEALMGALFLDGGIAVADKVFGETLFKNYPDLLPVWVEYPPHPLQEQEPLGDRRWIPRFDLLKKLTKFEKSIGVQFTHIRLLARSFTDRSIGYTNLTLGSNQRLEFLGDTVLQLIASEYLYKYFPEHHEGHLSLLRSSLVNNRTQAVVCDDLGMTKFSLYHNPKAELKTKDRADLLEAFLGALYVDQGLRYCEVFCNVCFFPRLQTFIMRQDWNDPKSKLQQCCLTLRTMEGGEPEIPIYKVIECMGPTNTRVYTVAVYFKGQRLAEASGHSIQQAEMNAAKKALQRSYSLFPQLDHQKRVIAKSLKKQHCPWMKANDISSQKTGNGSTTKIGKSTNYYLKTKRNKLAGKCISVRSKKTVKK